MAAPAPTAPGARLVTLTGSELIPVIAGGPIQQVATAQSIANLAGTGSQSVITALNTVGAGTITAAGIVGRVTTRGGSQSNAAFTDTTVTAAAIIAALSNPTIGESFRWTYQNTTNATATLQGGVGVTVSGVTKVPAGTSADFLVTYTAANTVTIVGVLQTSAQGSSGTFTATGATPVTVANTQVTANSAIVITLKTVGGTVSVSAPAIQTITPGTGFTVAALALDTSVYNYLIIG
jgi:hypothetical protein